MKSNEIVLNELRKERFDLVQKMNKIRDFKLNNTKEFLKLGSMTCQLLDTQLNIMDSYKEILTARIILLELTINDSTTN